MSAPPKAACVLMDECLTIVRLPCDTAVAKLLGLRRGSKAECTLGRCRSACMPPAVHASVCQRRQRELIHNIKITAPARPSGTGQVPQHGLPMGRMPTGARVARIHDAGVRRASAARKPRRACGAGVGCTPFGAPSSAAHTGRAHHRACTPAHAAHTLHAARRDNGWTGTPGKAAPSAASARMHLCIVGINFCYK
jgi:hypothetical protein